MKTWRIPVSWEEYGEIKIEAKSLKEALKIYDTNEDEYPLPEGTYIDGSFKRECVEFCKEFNIDTI